MLVKWGPGGGCGSNFKSKKAEHSVRITFMDVYCEISLQWMLRSTFGAKIFSGKAITPDGVSNDQLHDCLLNRLFRRRSNKTSKLRVTGEFPAQRASKGEIFSIWWRHHDSVGYILHVNNDAMVWTSLPHYCLFVRGKSPATGRFLTRRASYAHFSLLLTWMKFCTTSRVVSVKWDLLTATRRRHKVLIISHNIFSTEAFNRT